MALEPTATDKKLEGNGGPEQPTPDRRQELIDASLAEAQERAASCQKEVDEVLKAFNCKLEARPYIDDRGLTKAHPIFVAE